MFDLDGTLIDSVPLYHTIINRAFAALDLPPVPPATLAEALKDGDFHWDMVLPPSVLPRREKVIGRARVIIDEIGLPLMREQMALVPGTAETLQRLYNSGIRLGLVTSTPGKTMALKLAPLKRAGVDGLFEAVITADDVARKKPDAEPLIACGQRLGVAADRCAYVGDMRLDIRAGKSANMKTIGVLTGFDSYQALLGEKPDAIIESIARLEDASPAFSFPARST